MDELLYSFYVVVDVAEVHAVDKYASVGRSAKEAAVEAGIVHFE